MAVVGTMAISKGMAEHALDVQAVDSSDETHAKTVDETLPADATGKDASRDPSTKAPRVQTGKRGGIAIHDDDMRAMLVAEREARSSEEVLQMYEAVEVDSSHDIGWLELTQNMQLSIASMYCAKVGLPADRAERVAHKMRCAVNEERFADVGLPQQLPINRARLGELSLGQVAPSVMLRSVGAGAVIGQVGQAVRFPQDVCRKPHTVVIAGSYS